jgi:hypothetical protein
VGFTTLASKFNHFVYTQTASVINDAKFAFIQTYLNVAKPNVISNIQEPINFSEIKTPVHLKNWLKFLTHYILATNDEHHYHIIKLKTGFNLVQQMSQIKKKNLFWKALFQQKKVFHM